MWRRTAQRRGGIVPVADPDTGDYFFEYVFVYGHVEKEEYAQDFWAWHSKLPDDLQQLVRGFEKVEHGYGAWEMEINPDATSNGFLYIPAALAQKERYHFPVTSALTILAVSMREEEFDPLGLCQIEGAFIGKSSCRDIFAARPTGFSHKIIFAPSGNLALVHENDLPEWDRLWRKVHVDSS